MNQCAALIKEAGLKVTPQRVAIYNYLMNTTAHPNAETVYKDLGEDNPGLSLATVYKTLESFKNSNLIREVATGDGTMRYDANISEHAHVQCNICGHVYDMHLPEVANIREKIVNLTDFELTNESLVFYGKCPKCKDTSKAV